MDEEVMQQMILDIQLGRPAPPDEPEDHREMRERLRADIERIKARGGMVDIPGSLP